MTKPFAVSLVPGTRIVKADMSGLFSANDASGLIHSYVSLLVSHGFVAESFDLLVDMQASNIQPGDIVRDLSEFVRGPDHRPKRMAFVHGDNAVRMQARRVSAELDGRHFATVEEAMVWLRSPS